MCDRSVLGMHASGISLLRFHSPSAGPIDVMSSSVAQTGIQAMVEYPHAVCFFSSEFQSGGLGLKANIKLIAGLHRWDECCACVHCNGYRLIRPDKASLLCQCHPLIPSTRNDTTGNRHDADGRFVRRWPNVGAVGVQAELGQPQTGPSAYEIPST